MEIPRPLKGITILLVDDDPKHLQRFGSSLTVKGAEVYLAEDGQEALEQLYNGLRPDLVATDLDMPRRRGNELIEAVRAGGSGLEGIEQIPFLVISGAFTQKIITALEQQGGVDCLMRGTFGSGQMVETILKLLGEQN